MSKTPYSQQKRVSPYQFMERFDTEEKTIAPITLRIAVDKNFYEDVVSKLNNHIESFPSKNSLAKEKIHDCSAPPRPSETIKGAWYDDDQNLLYILFQSSKFRSNVESRLYRYKNVPREIYEILVAPPSKQYPSKGKFLNQIIKKRYPCEYIYVQNGERSYQNRERTIY